MGNWKDVGSLSVLAAGLGIGAALATTPGVAFAGPSVNGQVEVPAGGQIKVPTPCGDS